jgi:uncharacterized membrane protein
MKNKDYFSRFRTMKPATWIIIAFMGVIDIVGFYFSIAMSIKLSQGVTLFGDSNSYNSSAVETAGPTQADLSVLSLFWILTLLVFALFIYYVFFRKEDTAAPVRKEIVNGKTVIVKEEEKDSHEGK